MDWLVDRYARSVSFLEDSAFGCVLRVRPALAGFSLVRALLFAYHFAYHSRTCVPLLRTQSNF
jgi:hypothetical protein